MNAPLFDLLKHSIIFRRSRVLLNPPLGSFGFGGVCFHGKRKWVFEDLFRPFLRVVGAKVKNFSAEPDVYTQEGAGIVLKVVFHSPDALRISVWSDHETWMCLGTGGSHENWGGVIEQEFLIYWGKTSTTRVEGGAIISSIEGTSAIFDTSGREVISGGSGYKVRISPGENSFSLVMGYDEEVDALKELAAKVASEDIDSLIQKNQEFWKPLLGKLPNFLSKKIEAKAMQSVWAIESSTFAPEGMCSQGILGSGKTAYTKGMWLWDTCFAIRGYARINPVSCKNWLNSFMDSQESNGMFPGCVGPLSKSSETQVPLFSWAANAIFEACHDRDFLEKCMKSAVRNFEWWMGQGDAECGGLPASGPISYDNSPLYDASRIHGMTSTVKLVNPDIIAALVNDADEICKMAEILGDAALLSRMKRYRIFLVEEGHRHLYDEHERFYFSKHGKEEIPIKIGPALTAIVFAPEKIASELVKEYIRPGSTAWPVRGIATVLSDQPSYEPDNFWRGAIWGATNRLMIDALDRRGFKTEADLLSEETLRLFSDSDNLYEVFNSATGEGRRGTWMSGFGGGVFLDLALNRSIGFIR